MLSGFKNLYSKSVDLIKQVQDQVAVGQPSAPVPTIAPEKTHPGYHLVDRCCALSRATFCCLLLRLWLCRDADAGRSVHVAEHERRAT
jgi:hypothetical protein